MNIVIALGGNALLKRGDPLTLAAQKINIVNACRTVAQIAKNHRIILTHGNGPQVGLLALQAEAYDKNTDFSFDVLGAESEGMIGYMLEQQLMSELLDSKIAVLLTQVEVSADDPAFKNPSKFIGPGYSQPQMELLKQNHPSWTFAMDGTRYRRVIASPEPKNILEISTIKLLVNSGVLVICCGGGGIPVLKQDHFYRGAEAVIDKDFAAALLAQQLQADALMMLTDVKAVMKNWGTPQQEPIKELNLAEIKNHSFPAGSMGPKVEAAARFVKACGKPAFIGALEDAEWILERKAGTLIHSNLR